MRRSGIKIGRIFGIPIYLHLSWILIFGLITYSLVDEFGARYPQWSSRQLWSLGVLTSLLFFGSVLFHELSHSVVARYYRIPVASITLFFFGGIASITRDPERPGQEFLMAAAGPASSYVLAGAFWLLALATPADSMANVLANWLAGTNALLATFNLLPGFPLHSLGDHQELFEIYAYRVTRGAGHCLRHDGFWPVHGVRPPLQCEWRLVRLSRMVLAHGGPAELSTGRSARRAARPARRRCDDLRDAHGRTRPFAR